MNAALIQSEETKEEIIGVLATISVVSKRLARKLARIDKLPSAGRRNGLDGTDKAAATHADQGYAI